MVGLTQCRYNLVLFATIAAGFAAIPACGDFSEPPASSPGSLDGGTVGADGTASGTIVTPALVAVPGQLALRVDTVRRLSAKNTKSPLLLSVVIANGEGGKPVPLLDELFRLKTRDGRLRIPDSRNESMLRWVDGRMPGTGDQLAASATFTIRLAFDIGDDAAVTLTFAVPEAIGVSDGRQVTVAVGAPEPCSTCGDVCTYIDRDLANCGACGRVALDSNYGEGAALCANGNWTCAQATQTPCEEGTSARCFDLSAGKVYCGACNKKVPTGGVCQGGKPQCSEAGRTACNDVCVDLASDSANCGACDVRVAKDHVCKAGQSRCSESSKSDCLGLCVSLASSPENCGACGVVVPKDGACNEGRPGCRTGSGRIVCSGACVDSTSKIDCGRCGHRCMRDAECGSYGICRERVEKLSNMIGSSCNTICIEKGNTCERDGVHIVKSSSGLASRTVTCTEAIPAQVMLIGGSELVPVASATCACVQP